MKILKVTPKSEEITRLCSRTVAPSREIHEKVLSILEDVKQKGVSAALRYAKEFDGLQGNSLKISPKVVNAAAAKVSETLQSAIRSAIRNVRDFHKKQLEKRWQFETKEGSV